MNPEEIIIRFEGSIKLYDLIKELVVYEIDKEYDENTNGNADTLVIPEVRL